MAAVFISYAREDKDFVQKLQATFSTQNRETWVDLDDLYAGEEFWPGICTAIEEAEAFLFAPEDAWMLEELNVPFNPEEFLPDVPSHARVQITSLAPSSAPVATIPSRPAGAIRSFRARGR